jgi:broad specificity phosphatase PhoE
VSTTLFLVRHAAHDNVGNYLAGRTPGIRLGVEGRAQAARLGERMSRERFDAVIASPRERTQETAQAIAASCGLRVDIDDRLNEIDFGDAWTGKSFDVLNGDPTWVRWNTERDTARTAGGESMGEVQARAWAVVADATRQFPGKAVVLVTHADVIKALVCHILGVPLTHIHRFDINPASVTTVVSGDWGAKLLWLNEMVA